MFWKKLKSLVVNAIKPNNQQQITGQILQDTLNSIISAVGENATFAGIATPDIVPGEPDGPTFYLAVEPGEYINFGNIALTKGLSIIQWNGQEWKMTNLETDILNSISNLDTFTQSLSYTLSNRAILDGDSFVHRLENKAITSDGVLVDWTGQAFPSNVNIFGIYSLSEYENTTFVINAKDVVAFQNYVPGVVIDGNSNTKIIIPSSALQAGQFINYELTISPNQWSGYGWLCIVSTTSDYPQVYIKGHKDSLRPMGTHISKGSIMKYLYNRPIIDKIPVVLNAHYYINPDNLLTDVKLSKIVEGKTINLQTGLVEDNEYYMYYEIKADIFRLDRREIKNLRVIPALDLITACIYVNDGNSFLTYQTLANGVIDLKNLIPMSNTYLIRLVMPKYISQCYHVFACWADDKSLDDTYGYDRFVYPTVNPTCYIENKSRETITSTNKLNFFSGADGIMYNKSGSFLTVYDASGLNYLRHSLMIEISSVYITQDGKRIYGAAWFVNDKNEILASITLDARRKFEGIHVPYGTTRILAPIQGIRIIQYYYCGDEISYLQQGYEELKEENQKLKMYIDSVIPNYVYATNTGSTDLNFTLGSYKGLEWSFDRKNWTLGSESLPTLAPGQTVYLRGKNHPEFSQTSSIQFTQTNSKISLGGDIRTLIDYETLPSTIPDYCFYQWLQNSDNAFNIDFSHIKTIKSHGLEKAFYKITRTTSNIDISNVESIEEYALSQAFYNSRFNIIMPSKLKTIPAYGLYQAFSESIARKSVIDLSNITEIDDFGMYQAFYNTVLLKYINLSNVITVGESGLKEAFAMRNVSQKMIKAPDLSKITSVGIEGMAGLYKNSVSLVQVVAPNVSEWDTTKFKDWLSGTSAEGTIYKPSNLEIPEGVDGIPAGWTVKDINTYYG